MSAVVNQSVMSFNVDLLLKDELIYELQWRGFPVTVNNTVPILRKKLRKALKTGVPTDWQNLTVLRVSIEFDNCKEKIGELKSVLEGVEGVKEAVQLHRLKERVSHLRRRLQNLLENGESRLGLELRKIVDQWVTETGEWESLLGKRLSEVDVEVVQESLRKLSQSHEEEEEKVEVDVSEMGGDVFDPDIRSGNPRDNCVSVPLESRESQRVDNTVGNVNTDNSCLTPTTVSHGQELFTKLANPLERILKEIPPNTNGLDHKKLLILINVVNKIKRHGKLSDVQILEVVASYVSEPLLGKINHLIESGLSLRLAQDALLRYFIPRGMYEKLKRDMVHRPQQINEPLSMYVGEIKNNVELLLCDYSEAELIDIIIMGINQNDRSKLVFQGIPKTFQDLERMCMFVQNIDYHDQEREELRRGRIQPRGGYQLRNGVNNITERREQSSQLNNRVCHYCSRPGHFIRNCWKRQSEIQAGNHRQSFNRGGQGENLTKESVDSSGSQVQGN